MINVRKIIFSDNQKSEIENLLGEGKTIKEISSVIGVSGKYISLFCKENNLSYNLKRFSKEEDDILYNNTKLTDEEISIRLMPERSISSIKGRRQALGINKIVGAEWNNEDIEKFIYMYPESSISELLKEFQGKTKREIEYLAKKMNLKKSKSRDIQRRIENNKKTSSYIKREEIKSRIITLYNKYDGNVFEVFMDIKGDLEKTKYSRLKILNLFFECGIIDKSKSHLYPYIYRPNKLNLTLDQSFELYITNFNIADKLNMAFDKNTTVEIFKYWAKINNFNLSKENILSIPNFRKVFEKSKLETSIRKNFKNTREFLCCVLDEEIPDFMFSIQVPNGYWNDKNNVYKMIEFGIENLYKDSIINRLEDLFIIPKDILFSYFEMTPLHKNFIKTMVEFFDYNNIEIDLTNVLFFDEKAFDSNEELFLYKRLKFLGYDIEKVPRSERYYNDECDETYIPDFYYYKENKMYIVEYFGLYENKKSVKIASDYNDKTKRKIKYFTSRYNFIPIFPSDIKNNIAGAIKKLDGRN